MLTVALAILLAWSVISLLVLALCRASGRTDVVAATPEVLS